MPATRLRGSGRWWVAVAAALVMWTGRGVEAARLRLLASDYVYDGKTTYCWGARANVSSSDVSDDLIFVHGANSECPLNLHIAVDDASQPVTVGQSVALSWTVAPAPAADSALFPVKDAPALLDKRTRQRATIIHSNVHTCHFGSRCDAYRQGETDTNASTNQVGNLSTTATTPVAFSTRDITFTTPGKHILLAHIIVPGPTTDTRYDFAVFMTIEVAAAAATERGGDVSVQGNGTDREPVAGDATATTKSSLSHVMSKSQVIVLSAVGAFLVVLLLVVAVYLRRYSRPLLCARKGNDSDLSSTKRSNYCVRGSNLRTRSSDWTELYAIDDMLPVSLRGGDDANAIAILRDSSRQSTPCSTPTTLTDRTVADFRHDVARWDERSSASPITPSSSAILIAAIQDPDLIASTPANDCFVPLESLVLGSPPAVHTRTPSPVPFRPRWKKPFRSTGRKRRQQQSKNPPPEDSGDEQEADI